MSWRLSEGRQWLSTLQDREAAQGYALTLLGLVAGSAGKMEQAQVVLEEALGRQIWQRSPICSRPMS